MSRGRTAGTLVVLVAVLLVMLVVGWNAVSKPFPKVVGATPACQAEKVKKQIFRREVTVSVYNDSKRSGLADRTLAALERRSFRPGDVANAPAGIKVNYAQVLSTDEDDPEAQLVANQFKPPARVVQADDEYGPGVDVMLGPDFKKLRKPGPKALKLDEPIRSCVDQVDPGTGQ
jgi:hypothetical protein